MSDIIHLNEPSTADAKCGATSGYQVASTMQATLMEAEYFGFKICDKCFPPSNSFVHTKIFIGGKANGKTHLNEKDETVETSHYSNARNNYKNNILRVDATAMLGEIEVPIEFKDRFAGSVQDISVENVVAALMVKYKMPAGTPVRINMIHFDKS